MLISSKRLDEDQQTENLSQQEALFMGSRPKLGMMYHGALWSCTTLKLQAFRPGITLGAACFSVPGVK